MRRKLATKEFGQVAVLFTFDTTALHTLHTGARTGSHIWDDGKRKAALGSRPNPLTFVGSYSKWVLNRIFALPVVSSQGNKSSIAGSDQDCVRAVQCQNYRQLQGSSSTLEAFQSLIATQGDRDRAHRLNLYQELLDAVATHRVADRPDRFEPRQRKRRQKKYDRTMKLRNQLALLKTY